MNVDFTMEEMVAVNAALNTQTEQVKDLLRQAGCLHVAVLGGDLQLTILWMARDKIAKAIVEYGTA